MKGCYRFYNKYIHYWQTQHLKIMMLVIYNIVIMVLDFQYRLFLRNIRLADSVGNACLFHIA